MSCEVACGCPGDLILCPWSLCWKMSELKLGSAPANAQSSLDQDHLVVIVRTEGKGIFL